MNATLEPKLVEAKLCYDSAADDIGGTRGFGGQPRMLLFKWERLVVDLLLCDRDAFAALHGRVTANPAGSPVVGASARAGSAHAETDEHGQFVVMLDEGWTPRKVSIRAPDVAVVCAIPD